MNGSSTNKGHPYLVLDCVYLLLLLLGAILTVSIDFSSLRLAYSLFLFFLFVGQSLRLLPYLFGFAPSEIKLPRLFGFFRLLGHLIEAIGIFGLIYLGRYLSADLKSLVPDAEAIEKVAYPNSLYIFIGMFFLAFLAVFLFIGNNSWKDDKPKLWVSLSRSLSLFVLCSLAFVQYILIDLHSTFYSSLSYVFVFVLLFGIGRLLASLLSRRNPNLLGLYGISMIGCLGMAAIGVLI